MHIALNFAPSSIGSMSLFANHIFVVFVTCSLIEHAAADDSVRFDWVNSTTLQATVGADIVRNEKQLNIVLCYFDEKDRRFVYCNPNNVQVNSGSLLNPFGTGNARNLTYGIWLQSPTNAWVDKVFGVPFSPTNASLFVHITHYSYSSDDSKYNFKLLPVSADFSQLAMKFFVSCRNGTIYLGSEMDLTEYAAETTPADYSASIPSEITAFCTEACAEIYIRSTEKNTQQRHNFRVGAVCRPMRKRNESIEMFVVQTRVALNEFLNSVLPHPLANDEED